MNRGETFLILQTGLHSNHLLHKKAWGFQLSTVDYGDFQLVLNGMGRCSFRSYLILSTSCDCKLNPLPLHLKLPQSSTANLAEHSSGHLASVSHTHVWLSPEAGQECSLLSRSSFSLSESYLKNQFSRFGQSAWCKELKEYDAVTYSIDQWLFIQPVNQQSK